MNLDRLFHDSQFKRDFLIQAALSNEECDFLLAGCQGVEQSLQCPNPVQPDDRGFVLFDSRGDRTKQPVGCHGLCQKVDGALLDCPD